ncbi:hypothetical protein AAAC51_07620 [Priestia megaterium]
MFTQPGTVKQHDTIAGGFVYDTAGYVSVSNELYEDSRVTYSFATPTNNIVLIPKYLSYGNFLFVSINKDKTLHIGALVKDSEKVYGDVPVAGILKTTNNLVVSSNGTHFTVVLNDKEVFRFESAVFVRGGVRIYGEKGEVFYSCSVEEPQSTSWTTNAEQQNVEIKTTTIEDHQFLS